MLRKLEFVALLLSVGTAYAAVASEIRVAPGEMTLAQAQAAARRSAKPCKIVLGAGTYRLEDTLRLTAEDSDVCWMADGDVVISGSRQISGWSEGENGIWSAVVPWVTKREDGFRSLCANGVARPRAKLPKSGFFTILNDDLPEKTKFGVPRPCCFVDPKEFDFTWEGLSEAEMNVLSFWTDSHLRIKSVDSGSNKVTFVTPCGKAFDTGFVNDKRGGMRGIYTIENIPAALTEPGEWRLDTAAGRVYYKPLPGENPNELAVTVPYLERLVELGGGPKGDSNRVERVTFVGMCFADARFELPEDNVNNAQGAADLGAAVRLSGARECAFVNCRFSNIAAYAVEMLEGVEDCAFRGCAMNGLGGGAFHVKGGPLGCDPGCLNAGNEISDCDIGPYGCDFRSAAGVLVQAAEGLKIVHNDIHDGVYSAISLGWSWGYVPNACRNNEISHNHIWGLGKGILSDMGGVYTLGPAPGTRIANNVIHDVQSRAYGGCGIYLDQGSSHYLVENNLTYDTKSQGFFLHFGRENLVRNNIFALGGDSLVKLRREPFESLFFYNNIVYWESGTLFKGNWIDEEPYYYHHRPIKEGGHGLRRVSTYRVDYNVYYNPNKTVEDPVFPGMKSFDRWQTASRDKNSVWADPGFENIAARDFRIKDGSPALATGFRPIDFSTVGKKKAQHR